ncbi:multiple epidermal growth factor-like domains protein 6 [Drosophila gunungcola]|uniref:EB domain-containing protein n=1 Tax=Drosophila gunungcola TaxID=103775 RepID=A0A9P9YBA4_9MUSC|nr:multiple epidermal growth factor-like domains protein 6 [Drosophila gunungcola]KAI8033398.1 hypothetical protein M5D96_013846 [Drosophila gunungcola]
MPMMMLAWIVVLLAGLPGLRICRAEDLLELSCSSDAQCSQFERGRCLDMVCICTARGAGERVTCSPLEKKLTNIIGGPCPCPMPHADCHPRWDQCLCSAGHVPSGDRRRCLPEAVAPGGECEFQRQCQLADRFSSCSGGQCICTSQFELHEGRCLAVLQSICGVDKDCGSCGASLCLTKVKKCGCAAGYVHNHNMTKCVTGSGYGASCEHSAQCKVKLGGDAKCLDHQCGCRPSHYPRRVANAVAKEEEPEEERITCEPIVPFGALCLHDGQCRMQSLLEETNGTAPAPMVCKWGECSCSESHRLEDNKCIRVESGASRMQHHPLAFLLLGLLQFTMILYYGV